jgi:CRISPR-associated protein Cmr1
MKKLEYQYQVSFTTPAFLGNAEQAGQWRTPPFKALLRQWWRVAYAAKKNFVFRVDEMRREEGLLFGHAWLENDTFERDGRKVTTSARKSEVRIRLDSWSVGKLTAREWQPLATVTHPEVKTAVGADLYLGYGPVTLPRGERQSKLKANAAIQAGESTTLSLAIPDGHAPHIERALGLMASYGTLGGRSRNGWGSFSLTPLERTPVLNSAPVLRLWSDALAHDWDWPHAMGQDSAPLIWQTKSFNDWKALMRELAIIKIGLRRQFVFTTGKNAPHTEARHWLSYPVTNHSVQAWGGNARLPNSLRFKVRKTDDGKLVGVIFHMPCKPPDAFRSDLPTLESVWKRVHAFLDAPAQSLTRIPE